MGAACVQPSGTTSHASLGGLANDEHAQYALLDGRSGGQELTGGDASGEQLTLESTSHPTKGGVKLAAGDWLIVPEVAAPATPPTGFGSMYEKTDGKLYFKNDAGTEYDLTTGVSTHTLLSSTHTDTLAATVVAGDILIGNATPKWSALAKGTDGQVLTMVSGAPAWASAGASSSPFGEAADIIMKNTASNQIILQATGNDEVQFQIARGQNAVTVANPFQVVDAEAAAALFAVGGDGTIKGTALQLNQSEDVFAPVVYVGVKNPAHTIYGLELATAVAQTIGSAGGAGTDKAGADLKLFAGPGTGSGVGGHVILQTAPAGTTGAMQNAAQDAFTITDDSNPAAYLGSGVTSATPAAGTFAATGGAGTNIAGGDLAINGGRSTGEGAGGDVTLGTSPTGSSGSLANEITERHRIHAAAVPLTSAVAAGLFQVDALPGESVGGQIFYTVRCSDGIDHQSVSGVVSWALVKAGAVTTDIDESGAKSSALSSGTLTVTFAWNDDIIEVTATTSLPATVFECSWQVVVNGTAAIVPA